MGWLWEMRAANEDAVRSGFETFHNRIPQLLAIEVSRGAAIALRIPLWR